MLGVFLDTETNGLNAQVHKIFEIAWKIVDLKTGAVQETYQTLIAWPYVEWEKSDPESLKITEFTFEEIQSGVKARTAAEEIIDHFAKWDIQRKKAIFICQNPSFDRAFFSQLIDADSQELMHWPYHWLDLASMFWAKTMERAKTGQGQFPWDLGVTKDAIADFYHLPKEGKPHRAMNGVNHLLVCYQAVVGFPF